MTSVFLQMRLDSTRLPRKALLPLGDRTVAEHAMRALDAVRADHRMLLTTADSADELAPVAERAGWRLFVGPKDDVLKRFLLAAAETGADRIVRATGDNPLVSAAMADATQDLADETGADYAGFRDLPVGSGVEVVNVRALELAGAEATDPYEREHVSPFLYRRPERFRIEVPPAPEACRAPGRRITLDTPEDYAFLERLYADLYEGEPLDLDRVVPWLLDHPSDAG